MSDNTELSYGDLVEKLNARLAKQKDKINKLFDTFDLSNREAIITGLAYDLISIKLKLQPKEKSLSDPAANGNALAILSNLRFAALDSINLQARSTQGMTREERADFADSALGLNK